MRDFLKNFPTEMIQIYSENGNLLLETQGLFGKEGLTITNTSIPVLEGQIVCRILPNGYVEKYKITDSKYVKGIGDACDFYKISLVKSNCKYNYQSGNVYNDYSIYIGDNNKIENSIIGNDNKEE